MLLVLGGGGDDGAPELLVHRLCKFALKTINSDMGYLFDKFVPVFDQDMSELHQQGQTHQQYAAYQEYVGVLEQHLVNFVQQEGYGGGDAAAFLALMRQQVAEDAANVELQFKKTWEAMKNQLGDISELGPDGDEFMQQLREFYKPPSVDDLMQTVLNMTEYETFSQLMRRKVEKVRIMREMQRRKDEMMQGEMGLAHRFIAFATKVLNDDLEPFYKKCQPLFEQDLREMQQQGHTHEQYAAFQEFIRLTEGHFNAFIEGEGFPNDAQSFISEIQRLILKDKARLDGELQKAVEEVKRQRERSGDSREGGPMLLVCKPTSIGELIEYFVHYAEYETFNGMMRGRVAEQAFMKQLFSSCADAIEGEGRSSEVTSQAALLGGQSEMHVNSELGAAPGYTMSFAPPARAGQDAGYAEGLPQPDAAQAESGYQRGYLPPSYASAADASAERLAVTVPEGFFGGSQLTVPTPDGQSLLATIPDGMTPGMVFEIPYVPQRSF